MSSTTAASSIPPTQATQPDMDVPTPAATPQKRKRSVTSDLAPKSSSRMAPLDVQVPPADKSLGSTLNYGVYMHDLLKEPSNASPKLVTVSTDFNSAYEAMRKHAAEQINANAHWGATQELNTNHLYEILGSNNRVLLRYELDAVFPEGEDVNGIQIWNRASTSPAPPVHYGMYIDVHSDAKDRAEQFFVGGFKSLGEANHAMKRTAAMYLHSQGGATLYEKSIEVMNAKGQLQRRFTIEKGKRSENGSFVREADWHLEQGRTGLKVPVIPLPTPETTKSSEPTTAQPIIPQVASEVTRQATPQAVQQVPAPVVPEPQAARGTRSQSQRLEPPIEPANDNVGDEQPKITSQAKSKALAKSNTLARPKIPVQAPRGLTPHCTCRLPDDGSFMIGCDNEKCPIGWYHGRCINLHHAIPESEEWYCDLCAREFEKKKAGNIEEMGVKTPRKAPANKGGRGVAKPKGNSNAKKRKSG